MSEGGWQDPFEPEDPEAQERERRRREREERRRQRSERRQKRTQHGRDLADRGRQRGRELAQRGLELAQWGRALAQRRPSTEGIRKRRPSTEGIRKRRIAGLLALLAIAVVLIAGVVVVASYLDDSDPEPAPPLETISVTIPEGLDRSQIAEVAREAGLRGDYEKATRRSKLLDPKRYGLEGKPESLEGFLFPDTYELEKNARVEALVKSQLDVFKDRIRQVEAGYARSKNLTVYDVLIIASMIEKEVQVAEERKLVAAVIYNRLAAGMKLGIDATIRFATGNTDKPIKESDLDLDSPYNTYKNTGLPVGPIGSPGLDSIEAAARPAQVDHLYYVIKPGTCGEHAFTASESEFYDLSAQYDAAREAAGGKSPTEC